jgi:hypothetical protein
MKRAIALLFAIAALAGAQKFDVASVRISGPDSPTWIGWRTGASGRNAVFVRIVLSESADPKRHGTSLMRIQWAS